MSAMFCRISFENFLKKKQFINRSLSSKSFSLRNHKFNLFHTNEIPLLNLLNEPYIFIMLIYIKSITSRSKLSFFLFYGANKSFIWGANFFKEIQKVVLWCRRLVRNSYYDSSKWRCVFHLLIWDGLTLWTQKITIAAISYVVICSEATKLVKKL